MNPKNHKIISVSTQWSVGASSTRSGLPHYATWVILLNPSDQRPRLLRALIFWRDTASLICYLEAATYPTEGTPEAWGCSLHRPELTPSRSPRRGHSPHHPPSSSDGQEALKKKPDRGIRGWNLFIEASDVQIPTCPHQQDLCLIQLRHTPTHPASASQLLPFSPIPMKLAKTS